MDHCPPSTLTSEKLPAGQGFHAASCSPSSAPVAWEIKPMVAEIEKQRNELRDLIKHMDIHSNYWRCGYDKMTTREKTLFDEISSGSFSWENAE